MDLMVNPVITGFRQDVDGTIKELKLGEAKQDAWANIAEQGASSKLDNNKTATIDVSTYTEPVVINPTSGKDGMKKATITLSNIPSPSGSVTFYAWTTEGSSGVTIYTVVETPTTSDHAYDNSIDMLYDYLTITSVGEDNIVVSGDTYYRDAEHDQTVA